MNKTKLTYFIKTISIFLILLTAFAKTGNSQDVNYKAQSLYIYKFSRYIKWPESYNQRDFVIGVYGNSPILKELEIMASLKKAANNRKIIIRQISSVEDISDEHIIYIASSKSRELRNILAIIQDRPTLLVAEREGLAKKGACINFMIMENNYLKFEINTEVVEKQKLSVSNELLKRGFKVR